MEQPDSSLSFDGLVERYALAPSAVTQPSMTGSNGWAVDGVFGARPCIVRLQVRDWERVVERTALAAGQHAHAIAKRVRSAAVPRVYDVCMFRMPATRVPPNYRTSTHAEHSGVAIAMERAAGVCLTDLLGARYDKPLLVDVISTLAVLSRTLYRSQRRLVHYDLHCGNVFYTRGTTTVIDWELARVVKCGIDSRRDLAQFLISTIDVLLDRAPSEYIDFVEWAIKATRDDAQELRRVATGDGAATERLWTRMSTRRTSSILRSPFLRGGARCRRDS